MKQRAVWSVREVMQAVTLISYKCIRVASDTNCNRAKNKKLRRRADFFVQHAMNGEDDENRTAEIERCCYGKQC